MSYVITIGEITDPDVDLQVRALIRDAYDSPAMLPAMFLAANLDSKATRPSFFLVATEDGEIIGCNGFLANDFFLDGEHYVGYQSCWSATHPKHQGRKVFSTIINEAKRILKEQGAGFIYGIANDRSNPIFTKKLGFTETPARMLRIPNIPFIRYSYFNKEARYETEHACMVNESQLNNHKKAQYPDDVKVIRYNRSWLWGKLLHKRKLGISLPVFYAGGIHLDSAADLEGLIKVLFSTYRVLFVQFVSAENNTFNPLLRGWKRAKLNGFILYNLQMPACKHWNAMIGLLDIF